MPNPVPLSQLLCTLRAAAGRLLHCGLWTARGLHLRATLVVWHRVASWLAPAPVEDDGLARLGLRRALPQRERLYPWRLTSALLLWHFALVLVLLSASPWPTPPVQLLGWAPPHLRLAWLALVLVSVLQPDYDDWPAVRFGLQLFTLVGFGLCFS